MNKLDITRYTVHAPVEVNMRAAVLSDIHGEKYGYILDAVKKEGADVILIPGDIINRHDCNPGRSAEFLRDCRAAAPVFMSFGNHERMAYENVKKTAKAAGVTLLDDTYADFNGIHICGLTSGYIRRSGPLRQGHFKKTPAPDLKVLEKFNSLGGYRLLLSHHPEYYPRYERQTGIDLILSGHAHGGQWRFFGQPVFAPDQAFFPRYAQGFHDSRLIVSRGLANNAPVPRIFNNREIIIIDFIKD